jgi:ketosteroid isomerase-like protein
MMKHETKVKSALDHFMKAYEKKDVNGVIGLFSNRPGVVFIGTGCDEKCLGLDKLKNQFERDFVQSEKVHVSQKWETVSVLGDVAWLAAEVDFKTKIKGKSKEFMTRLSAVLEHREEQWRFVHMHISLPPTEQRAGESFPTCDLY